MSSLKQASQFFPHPFDFVEIRYTCRKLQHVMCVFSETLRLSSPWLHQEVHWPVLPEETRQDGPRRRVLRQQETQGQQLWQRGLQQHAEDAALRVHHQIWGKSPNFRSSFFPFFKFLFYNFSPESAGLIVHWDTKMNSWSHDRPLIEISSPFTFGDSIFFFFFFGCAVLAWLKKSRETRGGGPLSNQNCVKRHGLPQRIADCIVSPRKLAIKCTIALNM